jgi:hypothetical protein
MWKTMMKTITKIATIPRRGMWRRCQGLQVVVMKGAVRVVLRRSPLKANAMRMYSSSGQGRKLARQQWARMLMTGE